MKKTLAMLLVIMAFVTVGCTSGEQSGFFVAKTKETLTSTEIETNPTEQTIIIYELIYFYEIDSHKYYFHINNYLEVDYEKLDDFYLELAVKEIVAKGKYIKFEKDVDKYDIFESNETQDYCETIDINLIKKRSNVVRTEKYLRTLDGKTLLEYESSKTFKPYKTNFIVSIPGLS